MKDLAVFKTKTIFKTFVGLKIKLLSLINGKINLAPIKLMKRK
jgi:hypothetical protein